MKTYIYSFILLVLSILTISCENKLDIDPDQAFTTDDAYNTPEKVTNILTGTYAQAGQAASYGGQIYTMSELLVNNEELKWNGTFSSLGEFNNKQIDTDNTFVANFWLNGYDISNQANIVLDNLQVYENIGFRNIIEGEAKFLRAVTYFDLVRFFSKHNNDGIHGEEPGVPIIKMSVTTLEDVTFPSRNTINEVYDFIIGDLEDAILLLPENNGIFASSNAAKALLARVQLQIGNYERARDLSNEVIQSGRYSITQNLSNAYNNSDNSTEDIFAWQVTDSDGNNSMNTFWATDRYGGRPGNPDISIEDAFFGIFDDINDRRAGFFYTDPASGSGLATYKWITGNANIPFIRLPEMYLIRAESNFVLGTTVGATPINDINIVRTRSNAAVLGNLTFVDIVLERLRELSFEGHKLHDFKRLELSIGSIEFDDDRLVFPIPLREVVINPNLEQNDGY
ncbi:RagB/SusD family nutrient uptake outer membrane protein [Aquimarina sp. 2201CG5-10]|uniref:RagB/SusD family nutrient uptake outer membrane protein n=1 Tax=Aquimarina callyspongiae TaxID=3098150 RepID=UPI002AB4F049|nr:RagB/SusD family nutrient uptake outer membrane protein [Aquimarina sp. 2201CG5-10]MDY8134159.1 RagB/SusD family nutrient uptake outer membrane protein [Aquimarina sp. 2201CG5-10]